MILIILLIYFLIYYLPLYSELAQLAEHLTVNQVVAGSSPAFGANKKGTKSVSFFVGPIGREPNLKVRFHLSVPLKSYSHEPPNLILRFGEPRLVDYLRKFKQLAWYSPYFVERILLKTILNRFKLHSPAFGAKKKKQTLCLLFLFAHCL